MAARRVGAIALIVEQNLASLGRQVLSAQVQ
jgi:hypothetical protein